MPLPATRSKPAARQAPDLANQLLVLLGRRWQNCRKRLARLEDGKPTAEHVHLARVSARKLLSVLEVTASLTQDKMLAKARKGIKRQFSLFSPVRDADVQAGHLHELSAHFPQVVPFYQALLKRKKTLIAKAQKELAIPGKLPRKLLKRLAERLQEHLFLPHELFSQMKASYDKVLVLRRKVRAEKVETLHGLRVGFKKFRYAATAIQQLFPVVSPSAFEQMRLLQGRLGEIQDLSVLLARLKKLADKKLLQHADQLPPVFKALEAEQNRKIAALVSDLDGLLAFQLQPPSERNEKMKGSHGIVSATSRPGLRPGSGSLSRRRPATADRGR